MPDMLDITVIITTMPNDNPLSLPLSLLLFSTELGASK